jgi:hypothetical protein
MKGTSGCHVIQRERLQPLPAMCIPSPPADAAVRAAYGRQPGRSARPAPCHLTVRRADAQRGHPASPRCSAAPTASTSPAATTTAHPSERSSPTWHALRTA